MIETTNSTDDPPDGVNGPESARHAPTYRPFAPPSASDRYEAASHHAEFGGSRH